jgi:hypothetical protein
MCQAKHVMAHLERAAELLNRFLKEAKNNLQGGQLAHERGMLIIIVAAIHAMSSQACKLLTQSNDVNLLRKSVREKVVRDYSMNLASDKFLRIKIGLLKCFITQKSKFSFRFFN